MLILTYRDNEISEIAELNLVQHLELDLDIVLDHADPDLLLDVFQQALHSQDRESCRPATELISSRSGGNIMFFRQYLLHLFDISVFEFDYHRGVWDFDYESILGAKVPSDIVDLLLLQLQNLDPLPQNLIAIAACLAPTIYIHDLSTLLELSPLEVEREMSVLCSQGYLLKLTATDPAEDAESRFTSADNGRSSYQFAHDRIQQACYQSISKDARATKLLVLASSLLDTLSSQSIDTRVVLHCCEVWTKVLDNTDGKLQDPDPRAVELLCRAAELSNQPEVRLKNLKSALRIHQDIADKSGDEYGHIMDRIDSLLLDSYIALGNVQIGLETVDKLYSRTTELDVLVTLQGKRAQLHWLATDHAKVREAGEAGLRLAGFDVSFDASPEELMVLVIRYMSALPATAEQVRGYTDHFMMTDKVLLASQALLVTVIPSVYFVSMQLLAVVLGIGVHTFFKSGLSTHGCYLLSFFGLACCDVSSPGFDYGKAKALADLAMSHSNQLLSEYNSKQDAEILAAMYVLQCGVNTWILDDRKQLYAIYRDTRTHNLRAFNCEYMSYTAANALSFFGMARGYPLHDLQRDFMDDRCFELIRKGDRAFQLFAFPTFQMIANLTSSTDVDQLWLFEGKYIQDEASIVEELRHMPPMHNAKYRKCKAIAALIVGNDDQANEQIQHVRVNMPGIQGTSFLSRLLPHTNSKRLT